MNNASRRQSHLTAWPWLDAPRHAYESANRLTNYNSGVATYAYNGDGLRMSKTKAGPTEQFVWDIGAGLPLLLKDGTASYIYGPGGLLAQIRADNTVYYYHADQLGSVRALTNSSGAVVATYQYNAYGSVISKTGTITNPFGYAGEYTDAESRLIYLRARYYDPATQQFITRDPIYTLTEEPYGYVYGDPINGLDPSGLSRASETNSGSAFPSVEPSWFCWVLNLCFGQEAVAKSYITYYSNFYTGILMYQFKGEEAAYAVSDDVCVAFMPGSDAIGSGASLMAGTVVTTLQPGPHAGKSIPARGPQRNWTPEEQAEIDQIGRETGCHTCGTKNPGTRSGHFIPDQQPSSALNSKGETQRLYPHCLNCSRRQGGEVNARLHRRGGLQE